MEKEGLRNIPSVHELVEIVACDLASHECSEGSASVSDKLTRYTYPRGLIVSTVREVLEDLRGRLKAGAIHELPLPDAVVSLVKARLMKKVNLSLQRVINATGVIIHTCLGRSPLPVKALEDVQERAKGYCYLEMDLSTGKRAPRGEYLETLICTLTGAEAGMAVNNNAAAVLLALDTLARGKEVIVSRSQLVEIGGSFRMPEVMEKGGAILREVGTTNKTYLADYEKAITPNTALLLMVHPSNFRMVGFTAEVGIAELVALGREHGLPVMYDLGSGALIDFASYGLSHEPTVQESVEAGVDITTFSTDKLLGGPQGGVIVGKRDLINLMKKNPLTRALRMGKLSIAALEATLGLYANKETLTKTLPILEMIARPIEEIEEQCREFVQELSGTTPGVEISVEEGFSTIGGGSLPGEEIPTRLLSINPRPRSAQELSDTLRMNVPSILGRIERDRVLLDLRTVRNKEESGEILSALVRCYQEPKSSRV
ncbi:MAG TPA: L-seryl-tRNA(Sec) selenium transferase [Candidatus Brocadiales bacterium]|nr:L-seryl-tRNA(Sec) selenium transferase [Candidatus Brocadiales bacterium]